MKKLIQILALIIAGQIFTVNIYAGNVGKESGTKKTSKESGPIFIVDKVEILCCRRTFRDNFKKVHVVSNAGWSVFQNIGLKIEDAVTHQLIATFTTISGDFYTPCLNLINGRDYNISVLDGSGNTIPLQHNVSNPFLRKAPNCGLVYENRTATILYGHLLGTFTQTNGNHFGSGYSVNLGTEFPIRAKMNADSPMQRVFFSVPVELGFMQNNADVALQKVNESYPLETGNINATYYEKPGKANGFSLKTGIKATITLRRLNIGLGTLIGYQHTTRPAFSIRDTGITDLIGTNKLIYARSEKLTASGICITPQLDITYWAGKSIGISLNANYNIGPKLKGTQAIWQGTDINNDGLYTNSELRTGSYINENLTKAINTLSIGAGIKIKLNKHHDYVGHVTLMK